jgi:CHAT domain-containing protein
MNIALVYVYCDKKKNLCDPNSLLTVEVITSQDDSKHPNIFYESEPYSTVVQKAKRFSKRIKISSFAGNQKYFVNQLIAKTEKDGSVSIGHSDPGNEAQELYDLIIRPFEYLLARGEINHIAFIAGDGLRTVPFAALHDGKQFLMERYSVGLIPSFSYLSTKYYKEIQAASILAMGTNEFPPEPHNSYLSDSTIYEYEELQAIPSIEDDLKNLIRANQSTSKDSSNRTFLGKDFTLKTLQTQRDQSRIIHLSTHAEYRNGPKENSFIYFRGDDKNNFTGNRVTLADIPKAEMSNQPEVELVFLAACQTAEGGDSSAELGFSGAFIQARVKSVVASLWKVRYRETYAFSMEFYNQIREGAKAGLGQNTKAAAIRRTQIALKNKHVYIKDGNLTLSSGKKVKLPPTFPVDQNQEIYFEEPGDWAGLTGL